MSVCVAIHPCCASSKHARSTGHGDFTDRHDVPPSEVVSNEFRPTAHPSATLTKCTVTTGIVPVDFVQCRPPSELAKTERAPTTHTCDASMASTYERSSGAW